MVIVRSRINIALHAARLFTDRAPLKVWIHLDGVQLCVRKMTAADQLRPVKVDDVVPVARVAAHSVAVAVTHLEHVPAAGNTHLIGHRRQRPQWRGGPNPFTVQVKDAPGKLIRIPIPLCLVVHRLAVKVKAVCSLPVFAALVHAPYNPKEVGREREKTPEPSMASMIWVRTRVRRGDGLTKPSLFLSFISTRYSCPALTQCWNN